jgi:SagB-type dehydrogenase family enzyme
MSASVSALDELLSLRPGVLLASNERTLILLQKDFSRRREAFGRPDAMKRSILKRLAEGPCPVPALSAGDVADFIGALRRGGWLVSTVRQHGLPLYATQPVSAMPETAHDPPEDLVLSRFAVLRRDGDRYLVESPVARARLLVFDDQVWALIGKLARPAGRRNLPHAMLCDRLLRDLHRAGLAVAGSAEDGVEFDQWRPHELWFHARSRLGSGGYVGSGLGRTLWAEAVPARRDPLPGNTVELYRPDLDALRLTDRPLTTVLEERRSIRAHDDATPITVDQLAELLYRCAGVRQSSTAGGVGYLSRPHPSGGGAYELELYPVVRLARGLEPGMYHYDPYEHRLRLIREPGAAPVVRLLNAARYAAQTPAPPQVLIVVAARFGRLMRTYEELPYSLILKHVGVLYQTMYLVATAIGLAACGLGAGDAEAFNEATGLAYLAESSVGEFMLGGRTPR